MGLVVAAGPGARGQTNTPPAAGPANQAGAAGPAVGTNVTAIGTTTVVGHFNEARTQIMPSLGATESIKDETQLLSMSQGADAPVNQIITRFPGVAEDSAENGDLHVRGEHANLQYRIDDVLLPEGITGFGLELDPRFIQSIKLITGSLPGAIRLPHGGRGGYSNQERRAQSRRRSLALWRQLRHVSVPVLNTAGGKGNSIISWTAAMTTTASASRIRRPVPRRFMITPNSGKHSCTGLILLTTPAGSRRMASASYTQYEVPNTPGLPAGTDGNGVTWASAMPAPLLPSGAFNSSALNERQKEQNYYGVATYQKSAGVLDYQASAFLRRSEVAFSPDQIGDLYFNGVASAVDRALYSAGLQADGSYHLGGKPHPPGRRIAPG